MGHAHKHWRGADRLTGAGVATGRPFAMIRAKVDDADSEILILEFIRGQTLLDLLDKIARGFGPSIPEQHAIARAVGAIIPKLLKARWYNRDHKPSNLVVTRSPESPLEIAVLDCVGIRRYGWMGIDEGEVEEMLASLMIEPIGCGCRPRTALWASVFRGAWQASEGSREPPRIRECRETLETVKALIESHGDPRPRVNPLGKP